VGYKEAWEKLIHEKNLKLKISHYCLFNARFLPVCITPFLPVIVHAFLTFLPSVLITSFLLIKFFFSFILYALQNDLCYSHPLFICVFSSFAHICLLCWFYLTRNLNLSVTNIPPMDVCVLFCLPSYLLHSLSVLTLTCL
jgi:hypothetical protein